MISSKKIKKIILMTTLLFSVKTIYSNALLKEQVIENKLLEEMKKDENTVFAGPGIAVVKTEEGLIQGYIRNSIYTYHGIQYAEAKERFTEAKKVEKWDGVKLAFKYGPISPQEKPSGGLARDWEETPRYFDMDNNAQNLNIWTTGINDGKKRPVMVWLHGGGFSIGSAAEIATYDGANLSKEGDVVVVSINHRLNVLGFLDLSEYGKKYQYSGNIGMKDIVTALDWIQANIQEFGGDPNNVTVFGESGGGAKILALMTSPYAKGRFHKAIIQSGATEQMGITFTPQNISRKVTEFTLENLNIDSKDIESLQTVPYEQLIKASTAAQQKVAEDNKISAPLGPGYSLAWQPIVDKDYIPRNPITEDGFSNISKDIPLLIGSNLTEWEAISKINDMSKAQYDNPNTWSEFEIEKYLKEKYGDRSEEVVAAFLKAYPDKTKADAIFIDSNIIRVPMLKIMASKADQKGANVYSYIFSWKSPIMNGVLTSYHTAEIPFIFHNINKTDTVIGGGKNARILEKRMSNAWINFAKTGNPNNEYIPEWRPYSRENGATMIFDNEVRFMYNHDKELISILSPNYIF